MSATLFSIITALLFLLATLSGCRTALEQDPQPHSGGATSSFHAPNTAPNPMTPFQPTVVMRPAQQGSGIGMYGGSLDSLDENGDVTASQPYSLTLQASASPINPREIALIHLVSDGSVYSGVDYSSYAEITLNGQTQADGTIRYEFLTACHKIPNLTAVKVKLLLALTYDPRSAQVDSSQSSIRILDCGFSGDAGYDSVDDEVGFSDFGKR